MQRPHKSAMILEKISFKFTPSHCPIVQFKPIVCSAHNREIINELIDKLILKEGMVKYLVVSMYAHIQESRLLYIHRIFQFQFVV